VPLKCFGILCTDVLFCIYITSQTCMIYFISIQTIIVKCVQTWYNMYKSWHLYIIYIQKTWGRCERSKESYNDCALMWIKIIHYFIILIIDVKLFTEGTTNWRRMNKNIDIRITLSLHTCAAQTPWQILNSLHYSKFVILYKKDILFIYLFVLH